jgi:hypothetical protein
MSIASEITRLQGVKADILTAIGNKGVTVPVGSALDDCPGLIGEISASNIDKLSILSLTDNIENGRCTNTSTNQGIFLIPEIAYDSYDIIERNFRFVIDAFNQYDNRAFPGEYWTGSLSIYNPFYTSYEPNRCGIGTSSADIEIIGESFSVGDEIEEKVIIDNANSILKWKVVRNGVEVINKTYQNQTILIGTRRFYVFGLRFSNPAPAAGYNSRCTFIFDGSYIKGDGNLIWGLS